MVVRNMVRQSIAINPPEKTQKITLAIYLLICYYSL
jgi:hypothetical protein